MSLTTRCPACKTLFKVVPDQLRISEGWVRCGQCSEIFDASQHLQDMPPPATPEPVVRMEAMARAAPTAPATPITPQPASEATPADDLQADAQAFGEPAEAPEAPEAPEAVPAAAPVEPAAPEQDASHGPAGASEPTAPEATYTQADNHSDTPQAAEDASTGDAGNAGEPPPAHLLMRADTHTQASDTTEPLPEPSLEPQSSRQVFTPLRLPSEPLQIPAVEAHAEAGEPTPSFMRAHRMPSTWWQRPAVRGLLGTLAGLLLVALALQVVLQQRDRIAAVAPDTRPLLTALCGWAGCSIAPLRQIDAIVIDGSSFGRIRDNHYRLTIGIRNTGALALQMPALELSLTNSQAQTLSRRVILPEAFIGAPSVLEPGAEWNGALTLRIAQGPAAQDVAGYGLFAFYP